MTLLSVRYYKQATQREDRRQRKPKTCVFKVLESVVCIFPSAMLCSLE
jgi:hypothetical protein